MEKKSDSKSSKKPKLALGWPEWVLLGIVACSTVLIILAFCTGFFKKPQEKTELELEKIADAYYIEYLYPRLLGNLENSPRVVMRAYDELGTPTVYLRQLLHFNNDEYIESAAYFDRFKCDTNATRVKYYPKDPYGPQDYTVEYVWQCKDGNFTTK